MILFQILAQGRNQHYRRQRLLKILFRKQIGMLRGNKSVIGQYELRLLAANLNDSSQRFLRELWQTLLKRDLQKTFLKYPPPFRSVNILLMRNPFRDFGDQLTAVIQYQYAKRVHKAFNFLKFLMFE